MPNNADFNARWWEMPRDVRILDDARADQIFVGGAQWNLVKTYTTDLSPKGKRGEDLFGLLLTAIKEVYDVDALVAGGAIRDVAAGAKDHKDVDVFIPIHPDLFADRYGELGWSGEFRLNAPKRPGTAYPIKAGEQKIGCMFDTIARGSSKVQSCPIDLVFLPQPLSQANVKTFPVHAQRGVWSLEGGLQLAEEAQADIDAKAFTIDPTIVDKDKVEAVLEKIRGWKQREIYKKWAIVEPDIKEWWEKD